MKKIFPILMSVAALGMLLAATMAFTRQGTPATEGKLLKAMPTPSAPHAKGMKVVKADGFLFEDFESADEETQSLPQGWTATATPGLNDGTWHAGTLGRDGQPLNGVSGFKYAYILGNRDTDNPHDAWLFSPGLEMEAGKEYQIEFFALMPPVSGSEKMEKLQVSIGRGANAAAMTKELEVIENDNDYWRYYGYSFTPEVAGTYNIGFHCQSPAGSNSTVIDNLKITSGPTPLFSGDSEIDMGTTDTRKGVLTAKYTVSNEGTAPLEVSLKSVSEGVTVEGLPVTLNKYGEKELTVTMTAKETGDATGKFTLATNDLTQATVEVALSGIVKQARVTGYNLEDFENGGPEGWELSYGSGNVAVYGGHNSSRAYYTTTMYTSDDQNPGWGGVGFVTHYIEMGDKPSISFWYQMAKVDFLDKVTGPAGAKDAMVYVQLSKDGGLTWETVYTIAPDTEHEHSGTLDWNKVSVDVPAYAGTTCRLRVVFNQPGGGSMFNQIRCMADDVEIGTKALVDLSASALTGTALLDLGKEAEFKVAVKNLGAQPMADYRLELLDAESGSVLATADGAEVAAGATEKVAVKWTPTQAGAVKLNARFVSESDPVADNNTSYTHYVEVLPEGNTAISINEGEELKSMAYPINFYVVDGATQSIYYANEIGATEGVINSIVFKSLFDTDFYGEPFSVYIAETDKNDFSDRTMIPVEEMTKVFDGAIYIESGIRDLVIPFARPFEYHGKNLVVMCQKLGKEFVWGQYFSIHKSKGTLRSMQLTSYSQGYIAANGYGEALADEVYSDIRFNIVKSKAGALKGSVTDDNGAVAGARVRIAGTQRVETTDDKGQFSFAEVAVGSRAIEVEKHGYYTLRDADFTMAEGATVERNVILKKLPRYKLSGKITSESTGEPIANARIELKGYDDYVAHTDAQGIYEITGVAGDSGSDYTLRVSDGYFHPASTTTSLNADRTLNFVLKEKLLRAHNAQATATNNGTMLTWEPPMPEFRYDSGEAADFIGWTHGNSMVIVGSAFYKKAKIKEISWYVTNRYGEHQNFNVFVFGLDEEGNPDPENILYVARSVPYTDNAWSSHILNTPVEADGFMIAVSCDGFMGMGICQPTEEYPFEEGQCFYAGDSYNLRISAMSSYANVHPMLRAYGEDEGDMTPRTDVRLKSAYGNPLKITRPAATYKVYRCPENAEKSDWTLLTTTDAVNWLDTTAPAGTVRYAIVANYSTGEAEPVFTKYLKLSSIGNISDYGIKLGPNPAHDFLRLTGNDRVNELIVVNIAGATVIDVRSPQATVDIASLAPGMYVAILKLADGKTVNHRFLKK